MSRPFFSIIIPTYNRCYLLKEALLSVNKQLFTNYEIIVIDDGSTDETAKMIKTLDFSVKYIKMEHSGMAGYVRNQAAALADADYLAFLDSDDLWLPHKLQSQYQELKQDNQIKLLHGREQWESYGKVISQSGQKQEREGNIFRESLAKCIIGPSTAIINHHFFDTIGQFNCHIEVAEDYELWLRALNKAPCSYINEIVIIKRRGSWPSLSDKYEEIESFRIKALELLLLNDQLSTDNRTFTTIELARKLSLYIAGSLKRDQLKAASLYCKKLQLIMEGF